MITPDKVDGSVAMNSIEKDSNASPRGRLYLINGCYDTILPSKKEQGELVVSNDLSCIKKKLTKTF